MQYPRSQSYFFSISNKAEIILKLKLVPAAFENGIIITKEWKNMSILMKKPQKKL